ncbi:hypothetical protein [Actinacidiphila oryziradicis]|uniref:hypothetical protein n=1 Tax=Actinacidiphila oryziradicis TaxID=2571141 RepID=UPI00145F5A67|nr:hypothetical protein [Actinacidiphila oryziradicis]
MARPETPSAWATGRQHGQPQLSTSGWVLVALRRRAAEAGLPRIGVHDLRHTAAPS